MYITIFYFNSLVKWEVYVSKFKQFVQQSIQQWSAQWALSSGGICWKNFSGLFEVISLVNLHTYKRYCKNGAVNLKWLVSIAHIIIIHDCFFYIYSVHLVETDVQKCIQLLAPLSEKKDVNIRYLLCIYVRIIYIRRLHATFLVQLQV